MVGEGKGGLGWVTTAAMKAQTPGVRVRFGD